MVSSQEELHQINQKMHDYTAQERIQYMLQMSNDKNEPIILSSSFGVQSAVCLHLCTQLKSDIPVIFIDTGYLFKETYRFAQELTEKLKLNLHIYKNPIPPQKQEEQFGQLWTKGLKGIEQYNLMNKVEPMQRALKDFNVKFWLAGLRREQSTSRQNLAFIKSQWGCLKCFPILDWSDYDIGQYLKKHQLPYHPLWHKGYVSVGDTHTTKSVFEVNHIEQTRFFGLKRECGLHE
ncbi:MAG: phosphoadenylyl-sulfate reductase [Alphaproteobacteria bacterium]